ncbi:hypothetical protein CYMTET_9031 [Cymbomonas tetramitiformis]|uniref:Uncharacterized protein n=1 Tax=Cymbomonas tetramitiformis TaxID=36881 RepID=A0AAE0GS04_9CHLO|nr:hypothetical protein CYMTET_9031 [Cymbomonas tetramitiformis]
MGVRSCDKGLFSSLSRAATTRLLGGAGCTSCASGAAEAETAPELSAEVETVAPALATPLFPGASASGEVSLWWPGRQSTVEGAR